MADRELKLGHLDVTAAMRTAACAAIGIACALLAIAFRADAYALGIGWVVGAGLYVGLTWLLLGRLTPEQTKAHAEREDATRTAVDVFVVLAAIASLGAVVLYLGRGASLAGADRAWSIITGIAVIVVSWILLQTIFTMRYARLYFGWKDEAGDLLPDEVDGNDGGVSFNDPGLPDYLDFAYLAFTIGMTYQVSDQTISRRTIRHEVTKHALIAFVFGATIIASAVNLIASLT